MSRRVAHVAGAPISWGVCEVPGWGYQLEPDRVLSEMAGLGLPSTELGPNGYLPTDASRLETTLADHGLGLVAGFVPAVLHEPGRLEDELDRVAGQADLLAAAGGEVLVLAASTGREGYEGGTDLDDPSWASLVVGIARVIDLGSERGLAVALHPHQATVIEGPRRVERLLESSPVSLCVDTGHLMVGGADPVELTTAARDRVAHVHLKDVSADLAEQVRTGRMGYRDAVANGMYRPLGSGDVDVAAIVSALEASDYDGWYVLEQDTVLEGAPEEGSGPVQDVAVSLAFFERFGGRLESSSAAGLGVGGGARDGASPRRKGGGMNRRKWAGLLLVLALFGAACTGNGDEGENGGAVNQRDFRFVVVTHGQASDPFWSVAANGVTAAADDMGVQVEYQAPDTFDMVAMSQLIDAAVASQPDGLVVSIPDADALGPSIQAAVDAGIPVISMNSGSDVFADLGVLVHVGQTEFEAGLIAGQRFADEGVKNAICINQEVGNVALDLRCQGFEKGLGEKVPVIPVDLANPTGAQETVTGVLQQQSDLDGILTLGPTGAEPTLAALDQAGLLGEVKFATFDLSPEVLEAIDTGNMLFAIDQAQYLQGYLPIVLLTKYMETGALPLGSVDRVILTGPQIVTQETAAQVVDYSAEGLR